MMFALLDQENCPASGRVREEGRPPPRSYTGKIRGSGKVAAKAQRLELDVIVERSDFDRLEPEWNVLYERAGRPGNPFQSFAWCWHWVNHFLQPDDGSRAASELFIVTGRVDGCLKLVWPLVRESSRGLRTLTWIGAPVTQYGDVLVEGDDTIAMLRESWSFLRRKAKADAITLYKVREDAAIAPLLSQIGAVVTHKDTAPYVDMSQAETFQTYTAERHSKRRRNYLGRYRRRFEDIAPVSIEIIEAGPDAKAAAEELLDLKDKWLDSKVIASRALRDPRTRNFFLDTVADTQRRTDCRVVATRCGQELIGAKLNYVAKGHVVAHVISYNLTYEKWNPGHLTTYLGLERYKSEGIDVFDFMGPVSKFKLDWADKTVQVNDWAVPLSLKGTVWTRLYLGFARDRLKAVHSALPASVKRLTSPLVSAFLIVG